MMNRNALSAGLLLAGLAVVAHADDASEVLVVTADKSEEPIEQVNASVTVIDREQIEQAAAPDLLELLRGQTGIQIARTGGHGAQTSIFMRGSNSNQVLVLVDGVRVSSPHTGSFAWEHLNLDLIERIEIVRGPRATTWGSDAIGGVIQIFTRRPTGIRAGAYAGSYDRFGASASAHAGTAGGFQLNANLAYDQSQGFSSQNPNGFSYDPDRDGYHNRSGSLQLESPLGEHYTLSAQANVIDADSQFDQGTSYSHITRYSLKAEGQLSERWQHSLQYSRSTNDIETPAYFSSLQSTRNLVEWHNRYSLSEQTALLFGADYQKQEGVSAFNYDDSQTNLGVYGQWDQQWNDAFRTTASLRLDDHSEYGNHSSGQISAGWDINDRWTLYGNAGTAYRTPTLNELFHPGYGGWYAGNPNLKPEISTSVELGLKAHLSDYQRLEASVQHTEVEDLITYAGGDTFQAINLKKAEMDSLELRWSYQRGAHDLAANFTLLDAQDKDSDTDLLRRPHQQYQLSYGYEFANQWQLRGEWFHSGAAADFGARLDSYNLLNASLILPFNEHWKGRIRLDNLGNEDYALAYGYNTPGRSVMFFIDYQ